MVRQIILPVLCCACMGLTMHVQGEDVVPANDGKPVPASAALSTLSQKASYLIGAQMALRLKPVAADIDVAALVKGITDSFAGKENPIKQSEAQQIISEFQKIVSAHQAQIGDSRKTDNPKWLAENGKKPGVVTTASGLEYQVISSGKGKQPTAKDTVSVNYLGTLVDGTKFDSSYDRGEPAKFPVGGVIKGWTEALQLMHEGDKWRLFIPAELAYGDKAPASIGPNQILIFEVELLKVEDEIGTPAP